MKSGAILILVGLAAVVSLISPDGEVIGLESPSGASAPSGPAQQALAQATANEQWLAGEVVLDKQADGHFYADVTVDSTPARMLVDTGASVVALTGEDASRMGLVWNEDDIRTIGRGASGEVKGVEIRLDSLRLGAFEARDIDAVIVPEGLGISLLGQSFLSTVGRVEIRSNELVLGN